MMGGREREREDSRSSGEVGGPQRSTSSGCLSYSISGSALSTLIQAPKACSCQNLKQNRSEAGTEPINDSCVLKL